VNMGRDTNSEFVRVVSLFPDVCQHAQLITRIEDMARSRQGGYVCFSTVHMVMESYDVPSFGAKVDAADIIVTDGMPIVWMQKIQGKQMASRVRANDLLVSICRQAEKTGLSIGFYGGKETVIDAIKARIRKEFPGLVVSYAFSPPFRELELEEEKRIIEQINSSLTDILFVGLGCPKQENWMHGHRSDIRSVMLGVGASFDFYAGNIRECPEWLGKMGLEWLFRLTQEPRRLWHRYLVLNPRFSLLAILQLLGLKKFRT
jgi:N-acetylglucosaminyldiphosphoundecaprenol N-acetyl-beta-D-mannosaminyltransferase